MLTRIARPLRLIVELVLVGLGIGYFGDGLVPTDSVALNWWGSIALTYLVISFAQVCWVAYRHDRDRYTPDDPPSLLLGWASTFSAVMAAATGAWTAVQLVLLKKTEILTGIDKVFAVQIMVLAWFLLHWGFARIYQYHDGRIARRDGERALTFPRTDDPSIADYSYFAFTIGSSFATSDVEVSTSSLRVWVLVHSVASFFFNGLIIVLAFGTLQGA